MTAVLITPDDAQRHIAQAAVLGRSRPLEVIAKLAPDEPDDQLLGRDAVLQRVQHRAARAVQLDADAQAGIGMSLGIELVPAGAFLVAAAVVRLRNGREYVGWNEPRRIPETVARELTHGRPLGPLIQNYRQQWRATDTFTLVELNELAHGEASLSEALSAALDAWG